MVEVIYASVLFAAIAAASAIVAIRSAAAAQSAANALASKLVQHQLLREEYTALRERVNKLAGRYYRSIRDEPPKPETAEEVRARLRAEHGLPNIGRGAASE